MILVEVIYARPDQQILYSVEVPPHSCIKNVIELSGILSHFPEINLNQQKVGIFAQILPLSQPVAAGDRIEIYRPLLLDPKQARRLRIQRKR